MEALSREFLVALPWEMYADNLVVIAETRDSTDAESVYVTAWGTKAVTQ